MFYQVVNQILIAQDFGFAAVQRHNKYITALESEGIKIIKGYFSKKKKLCRVQGCNFQGNKYFDIREEKQTDINIALSLLKDAYLKNYRIKINSFQAISIFFICNIERQTSKTIIQNEMTTVGIKELSNIFLISAALRNK